MSLNVLLLILVVLPVQDAGRPLPELGPFLNEVRQKLRSDRLLLSQYTYTETVTERRLDKSGAIRKTEVTVSEVYPSLDEELSYRRVLSRNGEPVPPEKLSKKDRAHDRKVAERARKRDRESAGELVRREAREAEERRREEEAIDEMFTIYDITMAGRERIDGLDAIRLEFRPRPGARPKTRGGKAMSKVAGKAWFHEDDHQLMRIEAELIDDFKLGFGVLAKLHKGARMHFERKRVNGEIWLPAKAHFSGSARILLLKGMRIDVVSQYDDHRKFTVQTSVTFRESERRQAPKP